MKRASGENRPCSTAAPIRHAIPARAAADPTEHSAHVDGDDGTAQIVIPRQLVPQTMRHAQDPLPHGYVGKHAIEQVSGSFGHPTATAARTERAAFARKRDEPVEAAVAAVKSREPAGQPPALQKVSELLLDEAGQPFTVAQAGGLRAKGLEVLAHDLVERMLRGTPWLIARRGRGHSRPEGERRASEEPDEIGLNARARERQVADFAVLRV